MAQVKLFGYTDKLSVKAGDSVQFHVNADGTSTAEAQLVRLIHGDENPEGPGFVEEEVDCEVNGVWQVEKQYTQVGSFLEVADPDRRLALDGDLTLFAFINPNRPEVGRRQCLIGRWDNDKNNGFCLGINQTGHLEFWVGQGDEVDYVQAEVPLQKQLWYFVAATLDARTGRATLHQEGVVNRYNSLLGKVAPLDTRSHVAETFRFRQKNLADTPFLMAGSRDWHERRGAFVSQLYCGKIDRPGIFERPLGREELDRIRGGQVPPASGLVAYWDTADGYTDDGIGDVVTDRGPFGLDAEGYNCPVRGQTGWNWSGRNDSFRLAPNEYGGIEFHSDEIIDSNWRVTKHLTLPETLRSGVYAMRLRAGDGKGLGEEHVVFFVRPRTPSGKVAFLVPTATYLAYANERLTFDAQIVQPMAGHPPVVSEHDIEMYRSEEFGLSCYDSWADGSGVCYSSSRRPILSMRPRHRISSLGCPWGLSADLSIVAWLEHQGYDYDILTDDDLDREGCAALAPYRCVISGTHPEYYSEPMMDATEDYICGGGRYIYMGANGYYCNVAYRRDEPWVMECRKLGEGFKAWAARPGEFYMATNGQRGGPWKHLGRSAHKLMGVSFASEGFDSAAPYYRMPDSHEPGLGWITAGVEGDVIGDFGLGFGGAAGLEIDRVDYELGTPPHTRVIASSGGHTDTYILSTDNGPYVSYQGQFGTFDYRVRADMVYFPAPNEGAVFSAGSIGFGMALPINGFDNTVSRLLGNVVDAFISLDRLLDAAAAAPADAPASPEPVPA